MIFFKLPYVIIFSFNCILYKQTNKNKQTKVIKDRHLKKFGALLVNKCIQDGIHNNPNKFITNLTNTDLTEEEVSILNFAAWFIITPKRT